MWTCWIGTGDKLGDKNESQLRTALPLKHLKAITCCDIVSVKYYLCVHLSLIYNLDYSEKLTFQFLNKSYDHRDAGQGPRGHNHLERRSRRTKNDTYVLVGPDGNDWHCDWPALTSFLRNYSNLCSPTRVAAKNLLVLIHFCARFLSEKVTISQILRSFILFYINRCSVVFRCTDMKKRMIPRYRFKPKILLIL